MARPDRLRLVVDHRTVLIVINPEDIPRVQNLLDEMQSQFNPDRSVIDRPVMTADNPHVKIKTQYLYGKEVELIIQQGTVIGIVSAGKISQPSRLKLDQVGIAYAENVPLSEFTDE